MRAKVVIPNKYWILEDGGVMVGTLSLIDETYQLFIPGQMEESFSCDIDVIENVSIDENSEDFDFNQDIEFGEEARSPGWIRYQKKLNDK